MAIQMIHQLSALLVPKLDMAGTAVCDVRRARGRTRTSNALTLVSSLSSPLGRYCLETWHGRHHRRRCVPTRQYRREPATARCSSLDLACSAPPKDRNAALAVLREAVASMTALGTKLTIRDVRASVAIGRKADSKCSLRAFQPVTPSGPYNFEASGFAWSMGLACRTAAVGLTAA
jgi:hypothetical protein